MKTFLQILILFVSVSIFGQATQNIGYQAVVRNAANQLVQNQNVKVKVSLMIGATGEPFYTETHTVQTNNNGLFNIQIGGGTAESGNYTNAIYWAGGNHFVKTEIDPLGGSNYSITSTTQLLSVPYANYSLNAGSLIGASNYFVGFYKQTEGSEGEGENSWNIAISYVSPDKFLCQIYGDYYNGNGGVTEFEDVVFGKQITPTFYGWKSVMKGLRAGGYFGDEFTGTIETQEAGNVLILTFDYGDEDIEIYKFQRMD